MKRPRSRPRSLACLAAALFLAGLAGACGIMRPFPDDVRAVTGGAVLWVDDVFDPSSMAR